MPAEAGVYGFAYETEEVPTVTGVKRTFSELCIVGLIGLGLGFGVNAVRGSGSIKPTKNYFDKGGAQHGTATAAQATLPDGPSPDLETPQDPLPSHDADSSDSAKGSAPKHLEHDYQKIDFAGVERVFNDPATAARVNVFIDARNEGMFEDGHIPGAVLCNPYEVERYLDDVLECTTGVEKVIVYCEGGECEDSIFTCRELIEAGVPYESIYLYPNGFEEWAAKEMPVEEGREDR